MNDEHYHPEMIFRWIMIAVIAAIIAFTLLGCAAKLETGLAGISTQPVPSATAERTAEKDAVMDEIMKALKKVEKGS